MTILFITSKVDYNGKNCNTFSNEIGHDVAEVSMLKDVKTGHSEFFYNVLKTQLMQKGGGGNLKRSCWPTKLSKLLQKRICYEKFEEHLSTNVPARARIYTRIICKYSFEKNSANVFRGPNSQFTERWFPIHSSWAWFLLRGVIWY